MKICYYSVYDVRRARTNQIADMRMCEGFAQSGCTVELITPYVFRRDNIDRARIFDVFDIDTPFRLRTLPTPFVDGTPALIALPILMVLAGLSMIRVLLTNLGRLSDVVIMSQSTDLLIPGLLLRRLFGSRHGPLIVAWAHDISFRRRYEWVYRRADAIVGTNSAIVGDLADRLGIDRGRMIASLNPISESQLASRPTRAEARQRLGIVTPRPLVVYTGKLYVGQNEARMIIEAARQLPQYDFLLTGGMAHVVDHYRRFCAETGVDNVTFVGFIHDYSQVRYYQTAADVLVSYYSTTEHLTRYQLPNKTCEYMLTGNPIVTCDYEAVRDVLNSGNAIFVEPENPDALAEGIRRTVENPTMANQIAAAALQKVRQLTFRRRAELISEFFRRRLDALTASG